MIIKQSKLKSIRKQEKKIVFASGIFDITHAGHAIFLKKCKRYGTTIIGVCSDKDVKKFKYNTGTIMNENIRLFMVDSLKNVDYTILVDANNKYIGDNVMSSLLKMLRKLQPDYWIINEEDSPLIESKKIVCKELGIKLIILKRSCPKKFEKISSSKIIKQIQKSKKSRKKIYK